MFLLFYTNTYLLTIKQLFAVRQQFRYIRKILSNGIYRHISVLFAKSIFYFALWEATVNLFGLRSYICFLFLFCVTISVQTDYFIKIISLSHILLHRKNNFIDTIIYCFMELMLNNPSLQLYFPFRPCHKSLSLIYAGFDSVNCLPHTDIASKQPRSSQYKYVGPCFLHFGYIIKAAIAIDLNFDSLISVFV